MNEDIAIELAKVVREAVARTQAKLAALQQGEAWRGVR